MDQLGCEGGAVDKLEGRGGVGQGVQRLVVPLPAVPHHVGVLGVVRQDVFRQALKDETCLRLGH